MHVGCKRCFIAVKHKLFNVWVRDGLWIYWLVLILDFMKIIKRGQNGIKVYENSFEF